MTIFHRIALALVLMLAAGSFAAARAPTENARIAAIVARGELLYDYDQAAWHTTDVMVETVPRKRLAEIKGWLVEPDGGGLSVLYYGYDSEAPYGVFRAGFRDGRVVEPVLIAADAPERTLTLVERRMADARRIAAASNPPACVQKPFNTIIVPPASETAPVEVYLLTPQVKAGAYPFGLHYLVTVGADGKVASTRPFMKSCMVQALPANAVAAMVSHLLDPMPTEIHVWLSRWIGKPVYVMTSDPGQLWEVTGEGMRKVDRP